VKKIAIIGAGASGLISAIVASKDKQNQIDIYEKNSSIGKKIQASGNGRCNITNQNISNNDFFSEKPSFINYLLSEFDFNKCQTFFENLGLLLEVKNDGKVYPLSMESKSVLIILSNHIKQRNINLFLETQIKDIKKSKNSFVLELDNNKLEYDKVVIATGSNSYKNLGGTDFGLSISKKLGHDIVPFYPSLVQLILKGDIYKLANGVRKKSLVKLLVDGKAKDEIYDDILFTKYGISGLAILDLSQKVSIALKYKKDIQIALNLLPQYDFQKLSNLITKLCDLNSDFTILDTLCGLLNSKLVLAILKDLNIDKNLISKNLNFKQIKSIANNILNFKFTVLDTKGFDYAEVSGGGVSTNNINNKTYESKIIKNLFFCGEVIDIVGRRGGYNLHFAWGSGYLVGKNL
jgi:predicted Rossmann fold flavoprotein